MIRKAERGEIKQRLFRKLMDNHCFWSYDMENVEMVNDDMLIYKTIMHLDIIDIDLLFLIYPYSYIKKVWRREIAIQGDYYRSMNKFLAWYYFKVKQPDRYLKAIETRHLNSYNNNEWVNNYYANFELNPHIIEHDHQYFIAVTQDGQDTNYPITQEDYESYKSQQVDLYMLVEKYRKA